MLKILKASKIGAVLGALFFGIFPAYRISGNPFIIACAVVAMAVYVCAVSSLVTSYYKLKCPPFDEGWKNLLIHFTAAALPPLLITVLIYKAFHSWFLGGRTLSWYLITATPIPPRNPPMKYIKGQKNKHKKLSVISYFLLNWFNLIFYWKIK